MTEWELARYLIDAKKCVDSILYIARNKKALLNIGLREKRETIKRHFYINLCIVLDKSFPKNKKELCLNNNIIKNIYHQRDKNYAHKDNNYFGIQYDSWGDESKAMSNEIQAVFQVCKNKLPQNITLDFVPHDHEMFRYANGVTPEIEEKIKAKKHSGYNKPIPDSVDSFVVSVIHDIEDLKNIPKEERNNLGIVIEAGLNLYEMIQNLQDGVIKINVLSNKNYWVYVDYEQLVRLKIARQKKLLDVFDLPTFPSFDVKSIIELKSILFDNPSTL